MAAPDLDLNPFAVAVAVAGMLLGPKLSHYVGAYSLILLGWFAGLLFGLYRREDSKMPIWAFSICTLIGSLGTTVPLAEFMAQYLPFQPTVLLFPAAFAIPAVPDKWGALGSWVLDRWKSSRGEVKQ